MYLPEGRRGGGVGDSALGIVCNTGMAETTLAASPLSSLCLAQFLFGGGNVPRLTLSSKCGQMTKF
jgi:hypothetical protein